MNNVCTRALAAYYKYPDGTLDEEAKTVTEVEHDGRQYVVIGRFDFENKTLAVYRIRKFDGMLKRMKRWPEELNANV